MDENGDNLGEGQSDSPYLITMSLITIPRVEYYTIYSIILTNDSFGTLATGRFIKGDRLMGGRLIGVRLYYYHHPSVITATTSWSIFIKTRPKHTLMWYTSAIYLPTNERQSVMPKIKKNITWLFICQKTLHFVKLFFVFFCSYGVGRVSKDVVINLNSSFSDLERYIFICMSITHGIKKVDD